MPGHDLAAFIDHSVLAPNTRSADISAACAAALQFNLRSIVVTSGFVGQAKRLLTDSQIGVVSVVAFPHGTSGPDTKVYEATRAVELGADEIDYVISIGAALDDDLRFLTEEARAICRAVPGHGVKAILETGYFTDERMFAVAGAVLDGGVAVVKTSTGYGPRGATEDDVRILARAAANRGFVKASGGISDRARAMSMLNAGASLIGTSHGPAICTP